jgi:hypothetical protein
MAFIDRPKIESSENLLVASFFPREYVDKDWDDYLAEGEFPPDYYTYPLRAYSAHCFCENSYIILPDLLAVHDYLAQFKQFVQSVLKRDTLIQPIFIPVGEFDGRIFDDLVLDNVTQIANSVDKTNPLTLITYAITPETLSWVEELRSLKLVITLPNASKDYFGIGGDNFNDRSGFSAQARHLGLPVPDFAVVYTKSQLAKKYTELVSGLGQEDIYIKAVGTGGGFGVKHVANFSELESTYVDWLTGQTITNLYGALSPVELQQVIPGIVKILSFQYNTDPATGKRYITTSRAPGQHYAITSQLLNKTNWVGNIFNYSIDLADDVLTASAERLIIKLENHFIDCLNKNHRLNSTRGGIDFALFTAKDAPMLVQTLGSEWIDGELGIAIIEHNGGRQSHADQSQSIVEHLCGLQSLPYAVFAVTPKVDIENLLQVVISNNFIYRPKTDEGLLPIDWVYGHGSDTAFLAILGVGNLPKSIEKYITMLRDNGVCD